MKKSNAIVLTAILFTAIVSCTERPESVSGDWGGTKRDTSVYRGGRYYYYRYYGGGWYPIQHGNVITPGEYNPASSAEISSPSFSPSRVTTGGFGESAHSMGGESAGE